MNLDDVGAAIEQHAHYDPDLVNDRFWESLYENHGAEYRVQTKNPSLSDFQVWADDHDLVPELQDE